MPGDVLGALGLTPGGGGDAKLGDELSSAADSMESAAAHTPAAKSVAGLFDLMKSPMPAVGVAGLFDLMKGEKPYTGPGRREGSPGNYRYYYDDDGGGGEVEINEEELKNELLAMGFVEKLDHLPARTDKAHKNENGEYTEERKQLHGEIMDKFLNGPQPVPADQKPTAILMMGGPGSGKSSTTRGMDFSDFVSVDPDAIKAEIPEYQEATRTGSYADSDGPRALNAAFMAHEESSDVADQIGQQAVANRQNVLFDGTGKSRDKMIERVQMLKEQGYNVQLIMPHIPVQEGKKRAAERAKSSGRWVPMSVLDDAYSKIPANFMAIAPMVDSASLYDNNGPPGSPATLMYSSEGGEPTVHNEELFNSFQGFVKSMSSYINPPMKKADPEPQEEGSKPPSVPTDRIREMFQQGLDDNARDWEENAYKRIGAGPQPVLD
jgi:predicted ABC-type ATPase